MEKKSPGLLAVVSDLYFVSRIEAAVEKIQKQVIWLELELQAPDFVEYLLDIDPGLVIVDLNLSDVPWEAWITAAKSDSRTKDIPVVMYGSHMDVASMKAAKETGADQVVAKSRFVEILSKLLNKYLVEGVD